MLWAIQFLAVALGAATVFVARRWVPARTMIHLWAGSQLVLTAVAVVLDGGFRSPLMVVIVTPLALTAMALPTTSVVIHTGVAIAGLLIAGVVTDTWSLGVGAIWAVNLTAAADALRSETRAGDVVARTGGEEFAVLMPDTSLHEAHTSAERIRDAIAAADGPVPITASAGLAAAPDHGTSSTSLVRMADDALYAAKDAGRDRLVTAGM